MLDTAELPDDIAALKAMLVAAALRDQRKDERIAQLEKLVAAFKQAAFGRRSEKATRTSSSWRWKIWKRPSQPSTPKEKPRIVPPGDRPSSAAPIVVSSPSTYRGSRRSSNPKAWSVAAAVVCTALARTCPAARRDPGPVAARQTG